MSQEQYPQPQQPYPHLDPQTGDFVDTSEVHTDRREQTHTTGKYENREQTDEVALWSTSKPIRLTARSTFPGATLSELEGLFQTAASSKEIRAAALRNMGRFGKEVSPQVLFTGLCDPVPEVRAATLETLAGLAEYQPIPIFMLVPSLYDAHPLVRINAAWCLGQFRDAVPTRQLMEVVEEDRNISVRASALQALGQSNDPAAIDLLGRHLDSESWQMREAAIQALGSNDELLPFRKLKNFVLGDKNELVRIAAMQVLAARNTNIPSVVKTLEQLSDERYLQSFDTESRALLRDAATTAVENIVQSLLSTVHNRNARIEDQRAAISDLAALGKLDSVARQVLDSFSKDTWPDIRDLAAAALRATSKGIRISKSGISFFGLEPAQLAPSSLLAFALDASYVEQFIHDIVGGTQQSSIQIRNYVQGFIRSEYVRTLLNGRTAIVPYQSFYQNPVLARDFLYAGESRDAFITMLATGVIVPYLHKAQRPNEEQEREAATDTFAVWQRVCAMVEMQCLRFQWNAPPGVDEQVFRDFDAQLRTLLARINVEQVQSALVTAGVPPAAQVLLGRQLSTLQRKASKVPLSYADLRSLLQVPDQAGIQTEGGSSGQAVVASNTVKQFVDLAYYKQLAQKLHCHLFLSRGMMSLSALQEDQDQAGQAERHPAILDTLIECAGDPSLFRSFEAGLYVESLSTLSLVDVLVIRKSEAWEHYIAALEHIRHRKSGFIEHDLPKLHEAYIRLMNGVTQHLAETSIPGRPRNFSTYWQPVAAFEIEIGGARVSIQWGQQRVICQRSGQESPHVSEYKSAPYSISFSIGQAGAAHTTSGLSQAFVLAQGWLMHAKGEWQALLALLQDKVHQPITRQKDEQAGPVLYL